MLDIGTIRELLNEQAFENGRRAVSLGLIPELFPDMSVVEVSRELRQLESELAKRDLVLERAGLAAEELFAVQKLKYRETDPAWMARGFEWVAKITTVGLEMAIPAAVGMWLDRKFDTGFWGLIGIVIGVPVGLWHLLKMTKR